MILRNAASATTLLALLAAPCVALAQHAPDASGGAGAATGSSNASPSSAGVAGSSGGGPIASAPTRAALDIQLVPASGTNVRAGRITTVFDAPFDVVSGVITDFAHYHEFLPQVRESRVVRRRRGEADVYLQVPLLQNLGVLWSQARFTISRAPDRVVVDGHSVNGNVARFECRFEAAPVPGTSRTQVTLQILAVPSFPWPTGMLSNQQGRWGARGLEAMRDRAERLAASRRVATQRP